MNHFGAKVRLVGMSLVFGVMVLTPPVHAQEPPAPTYVTMERLIGAVQRIEGPHDPRAANCPEEERRLRTTALLGLARDEAGAIPVVEEILQGEEPCQIALRQAALTLLGRMRSEPAVSLLIRLALSDTEPDVRNAAFMHLTHSDDPRAGEAVRRALTAPNVPNESRIMAARSLARSERAEDRAAVVAAFRSSEDPQFRQTILTSLTANGSNVEMLIEVARSDRDESLRRIAVTLLSRSDDPRAQAALREIVRGRGGR